MEIIQGTLDLLILRALAAVESRSGEHGYGIQRRLNQASDGKLQVEEGSLYPALYRMERRGWVASAWGKSENNRRARFYRLTPSGRKQLAAAAGAWEEYTAAVNEVLRKD